MEPTRREFVGVALAPLVGLTLAAPLPARDEQQDGPLCCRWEENTEQRIHYLIVGRGYMDSLRLVPSLCAVLFQPSEFTRPNVWTFSLGMMRVDLEGDLQTAKKLAEQTLVEWMRAMLVEVERTAFSLKRDKP